MSLEQDLISAIKRGDPAEVARLLVEQPDLAGARDAGGASAVLLAVYYGQPRALEALLARRPRLTLHEAAAAGQLGQVRERLAEQPEALNAFAPDGFTALGLAAFFGHAEVVDWLLEAGADPNIASSNSMRVMPIHSSVAARHLAITRALLERGSRVNDPQADDFTPLHEAAQNGQVDMIELLVRHGAHVNARKTGGQTPLALAIEHGHVEAAEALRRHGGVVGSVEDGS